MMEMAFVRPLVAFPKGSWDRRGKHLQFSPRNPGVGGGGGVDHTRPSSAEAEAEFGLQEKRKNASVTVRPPLFRRKGAEDCAVSG